MLTSTGTASSIFGYSGEQLDTTGLIYLRARYLNPRLGLFLARDPWEGDMLRPGSMNGFNYVEGNPVNAVDPTGKVMWGHVTHGEYEQAIEWTIENEAQYLNWHLEFPLKEGAPGRPRTPDVIYFHDADRIFNAVGQLGEVFEIKPVYRMNTAGAQLDSYITKLNNLAKAGKLSAIAPTREKDPYWDMNYSNTTFDWHGVQFIKGLMIDAPRGEIKDTDCVNRQVGNVLESACPPALVAYPNDVVLHYGTTQDGLIVYWLTIKEDTSKETREKIQEEFGNLLREPSGLNNFQLPSLPPPEDVFSALSTAQNLYQLWPLLQQACVRLLQRAPQYLLP